MDHKIYKGYSMFYSIKLSLQLGSKSVQRSPNFRLLVSQWVCPVVNGFQGGSSAI